jgi:hypothetical protein
MWYRGGQQIDPKVCRSDRVRLYDDRFSFIEARGRAGKGECSYKSEQREHGALDDADSVARCIAILLQASGSDSVTYLQERQHRRKQANGQKHCA